MPINTKQYIQAFLKIRDKSGNIIPFRINEPQMKLYDAIKMQHKAGLPVRIIILKARQMGFSTLTEGIIFKTTATEKNTRSGVVAHDKDSTNNLLEMFKRFYDNLPQILKPVRKKSNAKEVVFAEGDGGGLNSSIRCMTAGNENIGRSETFRNLHLSELAFWPGSILNTLTSIMQTVPPSAGTMIVIESTANGFNEFKDLWDNAVAGRNDFLPVFCAWHELKEYRKPYNGFALTDEEKKLKKLYRLDNEQIAWRRWCIKNNCNNNLDKFRQEYPSCPEEAFIMSGSPVFPVQKVIDRINELRKLQEEHPFTHGLFTFTWGTPKYRDYIESDSIKFREDNQKPWIRIYEEPKKGYPYVIGADTKGEGKDYYAATVINNVTGRRVASMHIQLSNSNPFTWQLYCLGKYYNDALIGIEVNFNTGPIEELQRLSYPKQYVRRKYDTYTKEAEKKLGWKTDGNTRPLIIDKEVDIMENCIDLICDIPTLQEAATFAYDENGRPDAMTGKHDDLLFSDMIANEIRNQQSFEIELEDRKRMKWTDDMIEDYNRASDELKKILIKKWGTPK